MTGAVFRFNCCSATTRISASQSLTLIRFVHPKLHGSGIISGEKNSPAGKNRKRHGSRCHPRSLYAQHARVPKSASNSGRKRSVSSLTDDDKVRARPPTPPLPVGLDDPVMSLHPRVVFRAHLSSYSVVLLLSSYLDH